MQKALKWFAAIALILIFFVLAAYLLAKKYEEPVRNYIVAEVNKRLASEVHVGDINFSLLARFPSASLMMDSVWAEENIVKMGEPDTLLFFEKLYFNLNIFDIIQGKYKINEIEARDGFMHLFVDEKGYDNYHIWKESDDTTGFFLQLDAVHLTNSSLRYVNDSRNQDIVVHADDLWFQGNFSRDQYVMEVKGEGTVNHFKVDNTDYLIDRAVAVACELQIDSETETYAFNHGRLLVDDALDFNIAGKLNTDRIDLHITGSELDIIQTLALIPSESRSALDDYSSAGTIDFDCTVVGAFGKTESPRVKMSFNLEEGSIAKKGSNWELTQLSGNGSFDNGEKRSSATTAIFFDQLSGKFNGDAFSASFSVHNLSTPTIEGKAKFHSSIEAIDEFFNLEWIEQGTGIIDVDAHLKVTMSNADNPQARDFFNSHASGYLSIQQANIKLKDDVRSYAIDSAMIRIENNALVIEDYHGMVNDCSIHLKGRADNFLEYFFSENGKMRVVGAVHLGEIDLEALFPTRNDQSSEPSNVVVAFPTRADWNLEFVANSFKNGKFEAKELSGFLVMNAFKAEATSLHFLSQKGQVTGQAGIYRFAKNQFGVRTDFTAKEVNITNLFHTFNNFGQDFITEANLLGIADADVQFQAFSDSLFNIDLSTVVANVSLIINNGSITNFEPLISVADELKKKKMLSLFISTDELRKRLQNVQFATLSNEISIRNSVVTIPKMEINSSAVDMNVSGTHGFDDKIHYELDFLLSELLELKNRTEPYNEYVKREPSGRTRIFVVLDGTTDDFSVEVERARDPKAESIKQDEERQTVIELLRDEFKSMLPDTAENLDRKPAEIEIEFDPEGGTSKPKATEPVQLDKNPINRMIRKTETDKKKLRDGQFEDDDF